MRHLYTILFYLALPFILLRLLWRSRRNPDYRRRWAERFGFCPRLEKSIWVHSVSVGETLAAVPLIKALKTRYPHIPMLVTTMTITGAARVKAVFGDSVTHCYIPYDLPAMIKRFLFRAKPLICIIMETELWPNLFFICQKRHIPIIVTNARLSEKSARGYHRIARITRNMLTAVHQLAAQGDADANRFIDLGLPKEKITITGNLKFDVELPADLMAKSAALLMRLGKERLIWIAASTHQGEEEIVLTAQRLIKEKIPQALLILVPRHPERFNSVAALAQQQGFQVVRHSSGDICTTQTDVYLGDTMGELLLMYSVTDVALIAGSFATVGGHNMLEAAVLNKPIITGPQLFNFAEVSRMLLEEKGMLIVQNAEELAKEIISLFQDELYRKRMGNNAYRVVEKNRGALKKQLDLIKTVIEHKLK